MIAVIVNHLPISVHPIWLLSGMLDALKSHSRAEASSMVSIQLSVVGVIFSQRGSSPRSVHGTGHRSEFFVVLSPFGTPPSVPTSAFPLRLLLWKSLIKITYRGNELHDHFGRVHRSLYPGAQSWAVWSYEGGWFLTKFQQPSAIIPFTAPQGVVRLVMRPSWARISCSFSHGPSFVGGLVWCRRTGWRESWKHVWFLNSRDFGQDVRASDSRGRVHLNSAERARALCRPC